MSPTIPQHEKSTMAASSYAAEQTRVHASRDTDRNTESEADFTDNVAIDGVEDKAIDNKNSKASTEPTKKPCSFLNKLPAEIRLKVYEYTLDDVKMDGDGAGLDGTVTRPALLEVCKLVRDEAVAVYINKIFSAILDLREEHLAVKKEMGKMVRAASRTRNDVDTRRHGAFSLAGAQLTFRHGSFCMQLSRYGAWLDKKVKSLEDEGFDSKPTEYLMAKFKEMAMLSARDVPGR